MSQIIRKVEAKRTICRLDRTQMEGMRVEDLIDMLTETTVLDEQASIVHFLWMKMLVIA